MLQPSTPIGSLEVTARTSERVGGGSGAASPIPVKSLQAEELLPLSSSTGGSKVLLQPSQPQEDDERISLLDDSGRQDGVDDDAPGSAGGSRTGAIGKRYTAKDRATEKVEKRRSRSHPGPAHSDWNLRENFMWLWGGSQHAGLLCMFCSALCYALMGLLVRLLAVHTIPSFETVAVRCAVIASLSAAGLTRLGHPLLGSPNLRLQLLARAIVGFLAICAFFYSVSVLPLRDATVLNFTAPLFTALFARLALNEPFTSKEMAATASSLVGVLMVNQPPIIFGGHNVLPDLALTSVQRQETVFAILAALLSAALGGVAYCLVRGIGKTGEPPLAVVFVFAAVACPASLLCLLLFQSFVLPTPVELLGMVLVGVVAFAAQVLLTRSLQLEKAGRATAMQYVKVVGTYLLGVLFWGEYPSLKGLAGSLLISVSVAFIAFGDKESSMRTEERA